MKPSIGTWIKQRINEDEYYNAGKEDVVKKIDWRKKCIDNYSAEVMKHINEENSVANCRTKDELLLKVEDCVGSLRALEAICNDVLLQYFLS